MKTLKENFERLSAEIKTSGKPAAAWFPQYTTTSLLNAETGGKHWLCANMLWIPGKTRH